MLKNNNRTNNRNLQHQKEITEITTTHFLELLKKELLLQGYRFTNEELKLIWKTVIKIIARSIVSEKVLKFYGLGKIYVKTIPPRKMYLGLPKKEGWVDESKRPVFQFSRTFKEALYEYIYGDTRKSAEYIDDVIDSEDDEDTE